MKQLSAFLLKCLYAPIQLFLLLLYPFIFLTRRWSNYRLKSKGYAAVHNVSYELLYRLIEQYETDGWKRAAEYAWFDKGIDYDSIRLYKKKNILNFEWAMAIEGTITGPQPLIELLAKQIGQTTSDKRYL